MATKNKTQYEILGVPEDIDYVSLRAVYRTKIHEHKQNKISVVDFRRICRAYETLSDFDKRKHYNSQKKWISELSVSKYTPQQLAAEPDLIRDLKKRLE
jgi:curved DNA-binding protein CbpA